MTQLPAQIINGLAIGSIYALVAVSFTLIFGTLRIVYFAHGSVMTYGAYSALVALLIDHNNIFFAVVAAGLIGAGLGWLIERVAVRPLIGRPHLIPLVSTVSVSVIMEEAIRLTINGGQVMSLPQGTLGGSAPLRVAGTTINETQLVIFAAAFVLMVLLNLIVYRTWYGRAVRAIAQRPDIAAILGVDISRTASLTFVISSALTAIGGVLFAFAYTSFDPYTGGTVGLHVFAAVLIGGLGSLTGAAAGGLLLGVVQALAVGYLATSWENAFAFGAMALILIVRPQGLFGTSVRLT